MPDGTCRKTPIDQYDAPVDLPKSVDWRSACYVTSVRIKAHAALLELSATGCMEGQWYRKPVAWFHCPRKCSYRAPQVDRTADAKEAVHTRSNGSKGGIASEADYPYKAGSGTAPACDSSAESKVAAKFSKFMYLGRDDAQAGRQ